MRAGRLSTAVFLLQGLEDAAVISVAAAVTGPRAVAVLRLVSRFGDGALSVSAGVLLLVAAGPTVAVSWGGASLGAVLVQKVLKRLLGRSRPCERPGGPPQRAPIPDRGSFPSGHTLHAVMAATAIASAAPALTPAFVVVAVLMGASRVALGVHYPSDVLAGAAMGALAGWLIF